MEGLAVKFENLNISPSHFAAVSFLYKNGHVMEVNLMCSAWQMRHALQLNVQSVYRPFDPSLEAWTVAKDTIVDLLAASGVRRVFVHGAGEAEDLRGIFSTNAKCVGCEVVDICSLGCPYLGDGCRHWVRFDKNWGKNKVAYIMRWVAEAMS